MWTVVNSFHLTINLGVNKQQMISENTFHFVQLQ